MTEKKSVSKKRSVLILTAVLVAVAFVMLFSFACEVGLIPHSCSGEDCLFCFICSLAKRTFEKICIEATGSLLFAVFFAFIFSFLRKKITFQREDLIALRVKLSC